ncbi:GyrI-like domain-containing protein [Spiractinospora alimapuensis]|uniref:GyrI-like domain-containing protein n=1 Tax=Spiractinospora alimapuensis TaxID=2820884 RepID=UPI001F17AB36|nr:GyrI-like domain-containing protein [Spiractinospora alimapuensis]QVQ52404.1 GyrI-like domain-containing protein [Spiractinospora alimapuensis]
MQENTTGFDETAPHVVTVEQRTTAVIHGRVPAAELVAFYDRSFPALAAALERQGVAITGPAFAAYDGPETEPMDLTLGFMTDRAVAPDGDVVPGSLPAGRVVRVVHRGDYSELGATWEELASWIQTSGHTPAALGWEVYVTEPRPDMDPHDLRTELNWLLAD